MSDAEDWAALAAKLHAHQRQGETLMDTFRRLIETNIAARTWIADDGFIAEHPTAPPAVGTPLETYELVGTPRGAEDHELFRRHAEDLSPRMLVYRADEVDAAIARLTAELAGERKASSNQQAHNNTEISRLTAERDHQQKRADERVEAYQRLAAQCDDVSMLHDELKEAQTALLRDLRAMAEQWSTTARTLDGNYNAIGRLECAGALTARLAREPRQEKEKD